MGWNTRLQERRRDRGWSQDVLAEKVGVSRQAVSQWEVGQAVPEVENLVALADVLGVTLDQLVRDPRACGVPGTPEKVPAPAPQVAFLLRAKKATYAGHGAEVEPTRLASHDLVYREDDLTYHDTYLGGSRFSVEETLWDAEVPFWAMNYTGRVLAEGFSGDFLKAALAQVPPDRPFRGPAFFQDGDLTYTCSADGTFDWFTGAEQIYYRGTLVYECRFHGGRVDA
jgi:transcriptional regulator with XRE-family HTH domain